MSTTEMNPDFARAVRTELTAIGTKGSRLQRHQQRTRALALGIGLIGLAGATTGAAVVVNNLPGTTTVTSLGNIATATHTGTASIDLGPAPAHAATVVVDLTCLGNVGKVSLATDPSIGSEGDSVEVDCALTRRTAHIDDALLPAAGTTSIIITATPGTEWKAVAQYASSYITAWGVNAHGQTYGVDNGRGMPDLQAAQATNGRQGYILTKQLLHCDGEGDIPVYESDGSTVIGQFHIGNS